MSNETPASQAPQSEEVINRNRFMVEATVVGGAIVGLGLVIPLLTTLWPQQDLMNANKGWTPLPKDEFESLQKSLDKPMQIHFVKKGETDGYLVGDQAYYVWGLRMTPNEVTQFRSQRPDLFDPKLLAGIPFELGSLGIVLFSSLCPHLNCKFDWNDKLNAFLCPCHGSQFTKYGVHMRGPNGQFIGPAPRDLDPIPFRQQSGVAEVEWRKYAANTPSRLVVSYS